MTYPNTAPFQAHSDTSRVAAQLLKTRETMHDAIITHLTTHRTKGGATAEELANYLGTARSTINARLRELELEGKIIKTAQTRQSSFDRPMAIYVHVTMWEQVMGRGATKNKDDVDLMRGLLAKIYKEAHRTGPELDILRWKFTEEEYETLRKIVKGR